MVFFLACCATAAALMTFSKGWKRKVGAAALVVLIAIVLTSFLEKGPSSVRGEDSWWNRTLFQELCLYIALIFGIAAKYLWDLIDVRRDRRRSLPMGQPKPGLDFDLWDFVQPLLFSGVVFIAVVHSFADFSLETLLLSFQNGFFWQTIFQKKAAQSPGELASVGS